MQPFTSPAHGLEAFNCPHCGAYAKQLWQPLYYSHPKRSSITQLDALERVECTHCEDFSLWLIDKMIHPEKSPVIQPNLDLNEDVQIDYLEARSIVDKSPRGAVALLRLCIQKLCVQLGQKGENINADIAALVKKGLPVKIQQALDIVRVVGNNAVHPGFLDLNDNRDIAIALFGIVNLIADEMLTKPKEVEKLYQSLPQSQRDAIEKRDKP